jgi:hypothetical protein
MQTFTWQLAIYSCLTQRRTAHWRGVSHFVISTAQGPSISREQHRWIPMGPCSSSLRTQLYLRCHQCLAKYSAMPTHQRRSSALWTEILIGDEYLLFVYSRFIICLRKVYCSFTHGFIICLHNIYCLSMHGFIICSCNAGRSWRRVSWWWRNIQWSHHCCWLLWIICSKKHPTNPSIRTRSKSTRVFSRVL